MKCIPKNTLIFLQCTLLLAACQRVETVPSGVDAPTELTSFRGEPVLVSADFPKNLFDQTQQDFDQYYASISGISNLRIEEGRRNITYSELLPILTKHLSKYPKINSEDEITDRDLQRIFEDFPEIQTREEADTKRELIFDFYQTLAKRDIVAEVVELERTLGLNGRVTDLSPETLTTPEKNHLLLNPAYGNWYVAAAQDAIGHTNAIYSDPGENPGSPGNKANAFKHSLWNALSIRYILKGTPASENQAIDFTQDGTSKHEMGDNGEQNHDHETAMDLHNNMSARVWMSNEVKWGIGPLRKMPSVDDIINTMVAKATASGMHNQNMILNWHGGDNQDTWNNLYNNMYGAHEHLVHISLE